MSHPLDCAEKTDVELALLSIQQPGWFFCLASRYEAQLLRYVHRISGMQNEDVEDILQDVFLKTYQHLRSFDPRMKFSSWIYRIAHNESVSAIRKKSIRQTVSLDEEGAMQLSESADFIDDLERSYDRKNIETVLASIDEKYREVIILRYLEEKDYLEIADILRKPVSTVGNLLSRGKVLFKKEYEKLINH